LQNEIEKKKKENETHTNGSLQQVGRSE